MALEFPQILDLDKLDVYREDDSNNSSFFILKNLPNILTYGKQYFTLSYKDPIDSNLRLKQSSQVLFEFKDKRGNVIFSDLTDKYDDTSGASVGYVWIRKDPLRIAGEINDGIGYMTIVGEMEGVPKQWENKYNVRLTIPVEIRKDFINSSPILFQSASLIQTNTTFSESIDFDTDSGVNKVERSYVNISASHMDTYGGQVSFIELSYKESRNKSDEFNVLTTYPLTGSKTFFTSSDLSLSSSFDGLNPSSHLYKFPTPTDIRRFGDIEFKLRFMNPLMNVAQDLSTGANVEVSASIGFTGSKIVVDSSDGIFVTGSGALFFGSDKNNGFRYEFKPKGSGKDTDRDTLEFVNVVGGVDKKSVTLDKEGGINTDADKNTKTDSSGSGTIATTGAEVSKSDFSTVIGGISGSIKASNRSLVVGGTSNKIHLFENANNINNTTIGGTGNIISGSSQILAANSIMGHNSIIQGINHATFFNAILSGQSAGIRDAQQSTIIGGNTNQISGGNIDNAAIIGGAGNVVQHSDSVIIGMTNQRTSASSTVYVENLDVAGSMIVNQITASIVSSSILHSSGSNIFGDAITDTHTFNGHITASGNISASGDLYIDNIYLEKNKRIQFGSADTYISASGTTEDLFLAADDDIIFDPDGYVHNQKAYYHGATTTSGNTSIKIGNYATDNHIRIFAGGSDLVYPHVYITNALFQLGVHGQTDVDFKVGNNHLYVDDGLGKTGIGKVPTSTDKIFTVVGDISASGGIFLSETGSAFQGAPGASNGILFASSSGKLFYQTGSTLASVVDLTGAGGGGSGDITGVTAGTGLTGGGDSGAVTLNVIGGDGITANANDMAITAAQTTITSIYAADLKLGEDAQTAIDFETANEIHFDTNNSEKMIILSGGQVGIGTSVPPKALTIAGEISSSEALFLQGSGLDFVVSSSTTTELEVSGTISGVSASFGSTSNTTTRWTDGYIGNDEFIPIFPTDFGVSDSSNRGHAVYTDTNGGTVKGVATDNMFASKIIPKGYTAISGSLYGNDTSNTVSFYSSSLTEGTALSVSDDTIEAITGTGSAFTPTIVGNGSKYVIIKWDAGSSDYISGGKIYIKRT